ncbi:magnesium transporter MgtE N-terminal domain-containing protein [Actinoplanes derwentensis]|uniref:Helix-turn-helix domain-containing protein n=1 Tax=Actinoplanes derwentensis TaxID=113562 RepID=A0A1H2A1W9_9ACTN|nr:helix-turn-helix domain-containing protein [Actinoplanes derwentensis]GID83425.1 hypothetical protein Ade03nite_23490 [Actinoplanes derwentensis]SDT39817.1 Helix-turn-helix domain-containing protein [Actinoplanes derwentensis]
MVATKFVPGDRPDPRSIRTVEDLAHRLAQLRRTAPREHLEQDQPTIRQLSDATGLPRSTLSDAECGRSLPSVKVVCRIASACGIPDDELVMWVEARDRAAQHARFTRRGSGYPDAVELARLVPDDEVRRPALAAVAYLRSQSVPVDGELDVVLDALPITVCAGHLSRMDPDAAAECLNLLPLEKGVECLRRLNPEVSAGLLRREAPAIAAEHLQMLPPPDSRRLLHRLPLIEAGRLLQAMPRVAATKLMESMPPGWIRDLITGRDVASSLAADLIFTIGYRQSLVLLTSLPQPRLVGILAAMDHESAAGVLGHLHPVRVRKILAIFQDGRVRQILLHLAETDAAAALAGMPGKRAAGLVAELPPDRAADILHHVPTDRRAQIVTAVPGDRQHRLRFAMSLLANRGAWLPTPSPK